MHCCCRLYVLYKLPQLKFLDSSAFKDSDRVEAQLKGPYLGIVRVADDAVLVICAYDMICCITFIHITVSLLLLVLNRIAHRINNWYLIYSEVHFLFFILQWLHIALIEFAIKLPNVGAGLRLAPQKINFLRI